MSDNTTTVSYINSMGGCKSRECNSITKDIWDWARERNIWLSAAHIPGSSNVDADQLSRNLNLNLEWMLSKPIFQRIVSLFGKPDIDLFASRLNAQVQTLSHGDHSQWQNLLMLLASSGHNFSFMHFHLFVLSLDVCRR